MRGPLKDFKYDPLDHRRAAAVSQAPYARELHTPGEGACDAWRAGFSPVEECDSGPNAASPGDKLQTPRAGPSLLTKTGRVTSVRQPAPNWVVH